MLYPILEIPLLSYEICNFYKTICYINNNCNYKRNIYSQYLFSWANKWWSLVKVKSHRVCLRRVPEQDFHMSFQQMLPIPDDVTVQYGCKDSLSSSHPVNFPRIRTALPTDNFKAVNYHWHQACVSLPPLSIGERKPGVSIVLKGQLIRSGPFLCEREIVP